MDAQTSFYRDWDAYKHGFSARSDPNFWLGKYINECMIRLFAAITVQCTTNKTETDREDKQHVTRLFAFAVKCVSD